MEHRANPLGHVHPATGATDGDDLTDFRRALAFRSASHPRIASPLPASWHLRIDAPANDPAVTAGGPASTPGPSSWAATDSVFAELAAATERADHEMSLELDSVDDVESDFWQAEASPPRRAWRDRRRTRADGSPNAAAQGSGAQAGDAHHDETIDLVEAEAAQVESNGRSRNEPLEE